MRDHRNIILTSFSWSVHGTQIRAIWQEPPSEMNYLTAILQNMGP